MAVSREAFQTDDGQLITLAMDNDPPLGHRTWAVVSMQLIDELTAAAPAGRMTLQVTESGPQPRIGEDGFLGLVGTPVHLFPNLKNQSYLLHMSLQVDGYLPMKFIPQVPQSPTFPIGFVPAALGRVELHSRPTARPGSAD
jgi:hypothetical protein